VTPVPTKDDDDDKDSSLLRDDNLTKVKKQYAEMGAGRDNTRFGWMRTKE